MCPRRAFLAACTVVLIGAAAQTAVAAEEADTVRAVAPDTTAACMVDEAAATRTVVRIGDGGSLVLDDGSEAVIAGIVLPTPIDSGADVEIWPPHVAATEALRTLTVGHSVALRAAAPVRDRYGRQIVHAGVGRPGEPSQSVAAALVGAGHARVTLHRLDAACAAALLAREAEAQSAGRGLWSSAAYREREAWRTRDLLRLAGTFQIVSGRVRKTARTRSAVMLNFGKDWRDDFTVAVVVPGGGRADSAGGPEAAGPDTGDAIARAFAGGADTLSALEGRHLRVRGWIERRNGPLIEVPSVSAIEIVGGETTGPGRGVGGGEKRNRQGP